MGRRLRNEWRSRGAVRTYATALALLAGVLVACSANDDGATPMPTPTVESEATTPPPAPLETVQPAPSKSAIQVREFGELKDTGGYTFSSFFVVDLGTPQRSIKDDKPGFASAMFPRNDVGIAVQNTTAGRTANASFLVGVQYVLLYDASSAVCSLDSDEIVEIEGSAHCGVDLGYSTVDVQPFEVDSGEQVGNTAVPRAAGADPGYVRVSGIPESEYSQVEAALLEPAGAFVYSTLYYSKVVLETCTLKEGQVLAQTPGLTLPCE